MTLVLTKLGRYIGNSWIINDLSFEVKKGECLALLGPSGCGKSSTLRLIAGLDKPTKGSIFINKKNITDVSPVERRISMVFQSYALFPHLSVAGNLSIGLKIRGASDSEITRRVTSTLALMQIQDLAHRKPSELSGGQRQRVALARALLRDPLVYLLDEPMSNLDAQLREELRPELRRLIFHGEQPIVYVTHDQQEAMAMATKIAVLNNGKLEQIGTSKELYKTPNSLFVANFIGRPQINILSPRDGAYLGIRPEDIYFSETGISGKLIYTEWQGDKQLLIFDTARGKLRMLCNGDINVPDSCHLSWSKGKEHHFDKNTGCRINPQ